MLFFHRRNVVRVYRAVALINGIVVVVIDSVLGFLLTGPVGMVIVIVGIVALCGSFVSTVDVSSQRILVFIEGGHIYGLAAHFPLHIFMERVIGAVRAGDMGRPCGHIVDVGAYLYRGGFLAVIIRRAGFQAGSRADLHILVQTNPCEYGGIAKIFHIYVLVGTVEVVVKPPAGVDFHNLFVKRCLADRLPGVGTAQQDRRRNRHRRNGRNQFAFFGCHRNLPSIYISGFM